MQREVFKIKNRLGIHARPAGLLVKTAARFKSFVYISKDGNEVNGKSIMGVLMLEAAYGSKIEVRIEGEDEMEAMKEIKDLIERRKFDEE